MTLHDGRVKNIDEWKYQCKNCNKSITQRQVEPCFTTRECYVCNKILHRNNSLSLFLSIQPIACLRTFQAYFSIFVSLFRLYPINIRFKLFHFAFFSFFLSTSILNFQFFREGNDITARATINFFNQKKLLFAFTFDLMISRCRVSFSSSRLPQFTHMKNTLQKENCI